MRIYYIILCILFNIYHFQLSINYILINYFNLNSLQNYFFEFFYPKQVHTCLIYSQFPDCLTLYVLYFNVIILTSAFFI